MPAAAVFDHRDTATWATARVGLLIGCQRAAGPYGRTSRAHHLRRACGPVRPHLGRPGRAVGPHFWRTGWPVWATRFRGPCGPVRTGHNRGTVRTTRAGWPLHRRAGGSRPGNRGWALRRGSRCRALHYAGASARVSFLISARRAGRRFGRRAARCRRTRNRSGPLGAGPWGGRGLRRRGACGRFCRWRTVTAGILATLGCRRSERQSDEAGGKDSRQTGTAVEGENPEFHTTDTTERWAQLFTETEPLFRKKVTPRQNCAGLKAANPSWEMRLRPC